MSGTKHTGVLLSLLLLLCDVSPLLGLRTERRLEQFGEQTWQSDSGLPQNTVHSVLQTRDGFLWIATEAGLVRFDGVRFATYDTDNTPQLRSNLVNDLKEDSSGDLWISTTAGVVRERAGVFTATSGLPSEAVSSTYLPRKGGLLALTSAGIGVWQGGGFRTIPGTEELQIIDGGSGVAEDESGQVWVAGRSEIFALGSDGAAASGPLPVQVGEVTAIAAPRPGELWVGGRRGIEVVARGTQSRLHLLGPLATAEITTMLPDGRGGVWIGTDHGLARGSRGNDANEPAVAMMGGFPDLPVRCLFEDRAGALWVATTRGIARVSHGSVEVMPHRSRLTGVLSIFEDREGSLWMGTGNAGLTVLREQPFSTISEADGLSSGFVRAVFEDDEGTVWVGTNGGGLDRIDAGKVAVARTRPALSSDVVLSLAKTGGDLWVGTPNGLDRVRNGEVVVFTTEDGLADDFVRSLYADRDGSLWIGTRNGLSHLVAGVFTSYSRLDGLGGDLIGAILRTREGDLWVGTLGGLSRWTGDGFRTLGVRDGLGGNAVTSMLEDSAGTLWIGTQDGGLSRLRQGRLAALRRPELPETPFGLLEDSAGELWLSSRRGIARVPIKNLNALAGGQHVADLGLRTYGVPDGLRISEASSGGHPAAWKMRDGSLWFATLDGVSFVSPDLLGENTLPPPTVIEQVLLNDRDVSWTRTGTLVVPPGSARITIAYAGLSFVAPERVRYRYMLEKFDKDWVEAGSRREAFYTNVPPGRYRFLVVSSNNDGVWSTQPEAFNLRVQPTLLQTKWFYAVLALLVAALAFAGYRWRVLSVEAQYRAVLGERGRIAREIHDTLAQGYVAIAVQLELTERLLETSKEAARSQLEATKAMVRESLAEARSSIWNLRAQSESETLPSLLAAMAEARPAAADGHAPPTIKLEIQGSYRPVSRTVEREILRVAQEAVANSVRHARAEHIQVKLRYDSSTLELLVADDGSGFAHAGEDLSRQGHFGLKGMRERAARIGARLEVRSSPGQGTTVELQMDARRAEKEDLL